MKRATGNNSPLPIKRESIRLTLDGLSFWVDKGNEADTGGARVVGAGDNPDAEGRLIVVEALVPRTMLVPREILGDTGISAGHAAPNSEVLSGSFGQATLAGHSASANSERARLETLGTQLLAAGGMTPLRGERVVWSDPTQEIVALMAVPHVVVEEFEAQSCTTKGRSEEMQGTREQQPEESEPPSASPHTHFTAPGGRIGYTTPLLHALLTDVPTVWMLHTAGLLYVKVYEQGLRFAAVVPAPTEADVLYFAVRLGTRFPLGQYELRLADDGVGTQRLDSVGAPRKVSGRPTASGRGKSDNAPRKATAKALKRYFKRVVCE